MKKICEYGLVFGIGAALYSLIEVAFRGFTHWTMSITGGAALVCIHFTNLKMKARGMFGRCLACCGIITALEFIVGCVVNIKLGMNVWSYAERKFNVLGQICPLFSFFWLLLSVPALMICTFIRKRMK
ncbi:MAG: hypothetical protein GX051_03300 [Clostridiales bacterium]|nr:hypothetical protein [Clostridiales bacterium]